MFRVQCAVNRDMHSDSDDPHMVVILVGVSVEVSVAVSVAVSVEVSVGVSVGVSVEVVVEVSVGVSVGVSVVEEVKVNLEYSNQNECKFGNTRENTSLMLNRYSNFLSRNYHTT